MVPQRASLKPPSWHIYYVTVIKTHMNKIKYYGLAARAPENQ